MTTGYIPRNRLEGKTAVITASTTGIGLAIAKRLAQEGAQIFIGSRKQQNVQTAVESLASENLFARGIVCDVVDATHRRRVYDEVEKMGGLDILVLNAATAPKPGSLLQYHEGAWDKVFDTNLKAIFLFMKEFYSLFKLRGGGVVVLISSFGAFQPTLNFGLGAYAVSKTGLLGLTKVLAHECATENIRVNGVAPGIIKTKFAEYEVLLSEKFSNKINNALNSSKRDSNGYTLMHQQIMGDALRLYTNT